MATHQNGLPTSSNLFEKDGISPTQYEESIYQQRLPEKCDPWESHPPTINKYRKWYV